MPAPGGVHILFRRNNGISQKRSNGTDKTKDQKARIKEIFRIRYSKRKNNPRIDDEITEDIEHPPEVIQ